MLRWYNYFYYCLHDIQLYHKMYTFLLVICFCNRIANCKFFVYPIINWELNTPLTFIRPHFPRFFMYICSLTLSIYYRPSSIVYTIVFFFPSLTQWFQFCWLKSIDCFSTAASSCCFCQRRLNEIDWTVYGKFGNYIRYFADGWQV